MDIKKILFLIVLVQLNSIYAMYQVRCTPFASLQREPMKHNLYKFIDRAKSSLFISIFTFVDKEIARKCALAKARGVRVKIIMDSSSARGTYGIKDLLDEFDVPVLVYKATEGINHNKYLIADQKRTWMSSMNFTNPAYYKNRESAVLMDSKAIAKFYIKDFNETAKLILQQAQKEEEKKERFEKNLATERKRHLENLRSWKKAHKK